MDTTKLKVQLANNGTHVRIDVPIVQWKVVELTKAEYNLIIALCYPKDGTQRKITAIKFIREQYGLGLKDAKDIVDAIDEAEAPGVQTRKIAVILWRTPTGQVWKQTSGFHHD